MKKWILMIALFMIFSFCACNNQSTQALGEGQAQLTPFSPTSTPKPLPTSVDLDADPMDMVGTILQGAEVLFTEDYKTIAANDAASFGEFEAGSIAEGIDGYEFTSENFSRTLKLINKFEVYNQSRYPYQAILIRFMPAESKGLTFRISGAYEKTLWFEDGRFPVCGEYGLFLEKYPTTFTLEQNKWHYALLVMDDQINVREAVWQEGAAEETAYYADWIEINESKIDEVKNQVLTFSMDIPLKETVVIGQYWILGYEDLAR